MKTRPPDPVPTAFPTCGEVFHYLVSALDLTAWADAFSDPTAKRRAPAEIRALSDQLRDGATEGEGRVPSRKDFDEFIGIQVGELPHAADLAFVLRSLWSHVLGHHARDVAANATFLDRDGTRAWYARWCAPGSIYALWVLQQLLRRVAQTAGPALDTPLNELFGQVWADADGTGKPPHPLQRSCYLSFARQVPAADSGAVDPKTVAAWEAGTDRPSCHALGRRFARFPNRLGMLLHFAFAGLIEAWANTLQSSLAGGAWPVGRNLLLGQAELIHLLDARLAQELSRHPVLALADFERLVGACLNGYVDFLGKLPQTGVAALDLRVARFRVYGDYDRQFVVPPVPAGWEAFSRRMGQLWSATDLKHAPVNPTAVAAELAGLRAEHPGFSSALAGPLLAVEARLAFREAPPTPDSLQRAFSLYREALDAARYRAGRYAVQIAREALGLAALLHRRDTGEGTIRPWIKKVLDWWDLLGLGADYDHERLEQRIERTEARFTGLLGDELRAGLKSALPQLGLNHLHLDGLVAASSREHVRQLEAAPVDRRQKRPMSATLVGRDQTPVMEAIDRGQLELAQELVHRGADLNFINSTGDTCVTKAFARRDYALVLAILRRDEEPIRRETLLRVTNKMQISGLEQALSHGQVEILREMSRSKPGREGIDLDAERIWGQTPLYYAVSCLWHFRMSPQQAIDCVRQLTGLRLPFDNNAKRFAQTPEAFRAQTFNPDGVLDCIRFLARELNDLDAPNVNDHTAFTHAVECGLHDVAALLLAAGANVNHRTRGGATALAWAVRRDDCDMARLLLEYRADPRLFVEASGRPIWAMEMSERMRRIVPRP